MPYTAITKPSVGDPTKKTAFADAVIDDLDFLNSQLTYTTGGTRILNGSFEQDTDADGVPDGWAKTLFTGGSSSHDTTDQDLGAKSFKFTSPGGGGNGGGYLQTSDYFEVSPAVQLAFTWQMKSSVAGVKNVVIVYWYKADKTASATASSTIFTEDTNNPTSWAQLGALTTPPSDAKFAKLRLVGCDDSDATAGSTWFDDVVVTPLLFPRRCECDVAGTYSWVCPSGVYAARIRCVGGGGGGGGGTAGTGGGGGGAGGSATSIVLLVPGTAYTIVVGGGGAGGSASNTGTTGTNTTFNTTTIIGNGGTGGTGSGGGGGGGAGGSATGQLTLSGGAGLAQAAGTGGNGGSGASLGANGASGAGTGGTGNPPGGGGGGGGGTAGVGGAGATGLVVLEF